jgi:L-fucose isomerase-like protein
MFEDLIDTKCFHAIDEIENFIKKNDASGYLLLLAGGGVEALAEAVIIHSQKPVLLWLHGENNALAAGLEIAGAFQTKHQLQIVYGNFQEARVKKEISTFNRVVNLMERLKEMKLGIFGSPSDWLLISRSSKIEPFGVQFKSYQTEIITQKMNEIEEKEANGFLEVFSTKVNCGKLHEKDISRAVKAYLALKSILKKDNIEAFTLRCFDLLKENYTACLALSLLNDEGITAACEGDKHALIAMLLAQDLTGQAGWMANPSSINMEEKRIIFAHCTVPFSFLNKEEPITLKTHMESNISVAIEGSLHSKEVTVFRFDEQYKKMLAFSGTIVGNNKKNPKLCRTQTEIQVQFDVSNWLENSVGNHQIIVYGNILPELSLFCKLNRLQLQVV